MQTKINVNSIRYRPSEDILASQVDVIDGGNTYSYAGKIVVANNHFDDSDIYQLKNGKWMLVEDMVKTHADVVYNALKTICLYLPPKSYRQVNKDNKGVYMTMWKNLYLEVDPLGLSVKLKIGDRYVLAKQRSDNNKYTLYSKNIESLTQDGFSRYIPTKEEMPVVSKLIGYALNSANAKHRRFQERRRNS